ncbi:transposase family protein [Athalassotoga sp.]
MDERGVYHPKGSKLWKDTGFQGYEPCNVETHQPKKKPRGKEQTSEDKTKNKFISSIRVKVEHAIGEAKVFHIVRDIYLNHKSRFKDMVMEIACGLHNLRLDYSFSS